MAAKLTDAERRDLELTVFAFRSCERYCRERAVMAWNDKSRTMWHLMAEKNATAATEAEAKLEG